MLEAGNENILFFLLSALEILKVASIVPHLNQFELFHFIANIRVFYEDIPIIRVENEELFWKNTADSFDFLLRENGDPLLHRFPLPELLEELQLF